MSAAVLPEFWSVVACPIRCRNARRPAIGRDGSPVVYTFREQYHGPLPWLVQSRRRAGVGER